MGQREGVKVHLCLYNAYCAAKNKDMLMVHTHQGAYFLLPAWREKREPRSHTAMNDSACCNWWPWVYHISWRAKKLNPLITRAWIFLLISLQISSAGWRIGCINGSYRYITNTKTSWYTTKYNTVGDRGTVWAACTAGSQPSYEHR